MIKFKFILIFCLCFFICKSKAQTFSKFFGLPNALDAVYQTIKNEKSYTIIGQSVNPAEGDTLGYAVSRLYFVKLDLLNNTFDSTTYFLRHRHIVPYINCQPLAHKNIHIVAAFYRDIIREYQDSTGEEIILLKLKNEFDTISTHQINIYEGSERPKQILATNNGQIKITGTYSWPIPTYNNQAIFVATLDSNFNLINKRKYAYSPDSLDLSAGMQYTDDGGLLLFSTSYVTMDAKYYLILTKIDSNGNKLWNKIYFQNLEQYAWQILKLRDGNYGLLAEANIVGTGGVKTKKAWIMKVDAQGNKLWEKVYGGERDSWLYSMKEDEQGSLLLVGVQVSERLTVSDRDAWILKLDANGNKTWERFYNNYNTVRLRHPSDYLYNIDLSDKGYLYVSGYSSKPDTAGDADMWIMRLDSFGCLVPGCQGVGIDNIRFSNKELLIQPNPAIDFISIQNENAEGVVYYEILNMQGQVIKKAAWSQNKIPLQELAAGQYVLHVQYENELHALGRFVLIK